MPNDRTLRRTIAAALAVTACAPAVRSDRDETIPVPRGASWAWAAPDSAIAAAPQGRRRMDPAFGDEIFLQRFHRAVESTMQAKGFSKVEDAAQADFLLSLDVGRPPLRPARNGMIGVGVGFGRPWGWYRPWGYRPWGYYRPSAWFVPWGWGYGWYNFPYGPVPARGYGGYPGYPSGYGESRLVVLLRLRSSGDVAWRASYEMDMYDLQRGSQASVQRIVDKVFKDLP